MTRNILLTILAITLTLSFTQCSCSEDHKSVEKKVYEYKYEEVTDISTSYRQLFNDEQDVQIEAATAYGIEPTDDEGINAALADSTLVRINDCDLYYLHDVTYPYLTPAAADVLMQIGRMYRQRRDDKLRVTSCMRTLEHVEKLRHRNRNAIANSCQLYGTTFDISYSKMERDRRKDLACVLQSLRNAGYIYVKYEAKQPCFHITIRRK